MNEMVKLQKLFFEYLNSNDKSKSFHIILNSNCENSSMLYKIKKIIDELSYDSAKSFINSVFIISKNTINYSLIENIQSQLNNKTMVKMDKINLANIEIINFDNFVKKRENTEINIKNENKLVNSKLYKYIYKYDLKSSLFSNYIFSKLLNLDFANLELGYINNESYLLSSKNINNNVNIQCEKENSLVTTIEIENFIKNIASDSIENTVKHIFFDSIVNSFTDTGNLGINETLLTNNDYYILNSITIKKSILFDCLYRNFYEYIKEQSEMISDNYESISDFISDLNEKNIIDSRYSVILNENITKIFEYEKTKKALDSIAEETDVDIFDSRRLDQNNKLINNLKTISESLNMNCQVLKKGYTRISTLIISVIIFGISIAIIILKR